MIHRAVFIVRISLLAALLFSLVQPQANASAAASLTIRPLTWNVIGLDSNNVNVGPNHFPVGARVCNSGDSPAANVTATLVWDSANAFIDFRPGTNSTLSVDSLAAGVCTDFYFEVQVTRNASAYNTTRRYHITATADGGLSVSTPTPRELFVEFLVSQNRNAVTDVRLDGVSIPNGGTMTLLVGNTYTIQLVGNTATNGYEQIESFINFPNTIFQVLSVNTTYSAESSSNLAPPYDSLYGDACLWENNPNSPNYRACLGVGKAGGAVTVTYQIRILQAPVAPLVNPSPLSTLIYDFSGSSYHYNADYGVSTRYAYVLDPSAVTISKNFSPDPTTAGGISTLTFTLTNPTPTTMSGMNFTDSLPASPGAMTVAGTPNASTTGCGSPVFSPTAGSSLISFSNGSIAPNSTCTIKVNVTVPAAGTYTNTTSHLFVGTLDTGNSATDTLSVGSTPPGPVPVCGLSLAQWTFPAGFNTASPAPSSGSGIATPGAGIVSTSFAEGTNSWGSSGAVGLGAVLSTSNNDFVQFQLNTTGYSSVSLTFDAARKNTPNSPRGIAVYSSSSTANNPEPNSPLYTNSTALPLSTTAFSSFGSLTFTPPGNTTYVRIYFFNAGNDASGSDIFIDNVTFTGCATPTPPAITKAFSPASIAVNGISALTFTLSNANSVSLTGVTFSDTLPSGVEVAAVPSASTTCGGTPTWSPAAGNTILTFGTPSAGTIPAKSSCTVSVNITGTASGSYQNISGFISSTNGGTNSGSTGIATASLTVLKPPSITKRFGTNPILTGGTSTLVFTINNPNLNDALTGVAFTDNYPVGLQNAAVPGSGTTCSGGTVTAAANGTSVSLTGATIAAGGSCTVSVNVTASTADTYPNTSSVVTSANGGTGNTASDILTVEAPNPSIALLKQISVSASGPWTSYITVEEGTGVFYRFTIENTGDVPLSPVSVDDPSVSTSGCAWPASLPVASAGNDNHIATCVVGPIAASNGSHINTAAASGMFGGTPYTSLSSSARYATPALTLVKTASETSYTSPGDLLHYSYLVTNSGFAPLLGPVTVADDKASVSCPPVDTVGDNDEYLDPGEPITCTAAYTVTGADVTSGSVTNTASANIDGVTSNEDSYTVNTLRPDLTLTKTNNVSGSLPQNSTFNWTITVTNAGIAPASFASGNVILADTLPGAESYYPDGDIPVANGSIPPTGTVVCSIAGTDLSCAASGAVTLPVDSSFSVSFAVTSSAVGSLANTATADPDDLVIEINETNNSGTDTVTVLAPPSIEKQFTPDTIFVDETSTLTIQISNSNPVAALTGVAFTDTLPAGLVLVSDVETPQCGGIVTGAGGGSTLLLSGGSIPASDNCVITATVAASSAGTYVNTTGNVSSTNAGTGNTATDTLTVSPHIDLSLDKQVSNDTPSVSDTLTFTLVVSNGGPSTATNIVITDVMPSGYSYVGSSITGGNAHNDANPSTSGLTWTINSLAAGASVDLTYQATVLETGLYDNYAEIQSQNETDVDSTPGNASTTEDDDDTASVNPTSSASLVLTKTAALNDAVVAPAGVVDAGDTITYTFSIENTGDVTITAIDVTDPLLPSLVCSIVSLTPGSTASCTPSDNIYTLTQADIDSGSRANTATATGQDSSGNDVGDTDTKTTTLTPSPTIELTKTSVVDDTVIAPSGVVNAGDTITYSFSVENTGNVTVTGIDVTDPLLPGLICSIASVAPGASTACSATNNVYTLTQADIDAGSRANTATATGVDPDENDTTDTDTETTALTQTPSLTLVKEVSSDNNTWIDSSVSVSVGDTVYFRLRVSNTGNTTLTGLRVDDGMAGCTLARGTDLTGDGDNAFEAGEEWVYTCSVTAVTGTNNNTATADSNETSPDSDSASYVAGAALVADPAISKAGSPTQAAVGETVTFTITVTNTGNAPASDVVVTDLLPAMFDVTAVAVTGAPFGTLVNVSPAIGTGPAPYTVIVSLGGDLAPTDRVIITIVTTVNSLGNPPVRNTASLTTSSLTDLIANNSATASLTTRASSTRRSLPDTGFEKGVETVLPAQPSSLAYGSTDVVLEIPSLGVTIPVVGVPRKNGTWNVSWLGDQAGWLEGSAFPSWSGNSVLTSHVYLANGLPGPFVNLNKLSYGDRVIVQAFGQTYTFAVQSNTVVEPTDETVMRHEEKPVLTLVTCKDYDEKSNSYLKRVVVRAVLVSVD